MSLPQHCHPFKNSHSFILDDLTVLIVYMTFIIFLFLITVFFFPQGGKTGLCQGCGSRRKGSSSAQTRHSGWDSAGWRPASPDSGPRLRVPPRQGRNLQLSQVAGHPGTRVRTHGAQGGHTGLRGDTRGSGGTHGAQGAPGPHSRTSEQRRLCGKSPPHSVPMSPQACGCI